ncbi:hypothetical protein FXO38_21097 [Capsicum annuum]|nr:hypothetical protein FXO38_21097 [Capsicum annuum]KAF3663387.1 hypothetical protein FXO37_12006 [Capsicum annuum]
MDASLIQATNLGNMGHLSIEEYNFLMNQTFQSLTFFPTGMSSTLVSPLFIPWTPQGQLFKNNTCLSQEGNLEGGSTPPIDSLRQCNQELQGILDSIGEQNTEAYPLGNMFHKEFKESCREATLVYAPESLKKCHLRILKPQDSTHLTITLKAVKMKKSLTNQGKGKDLIESQNNSVQMTSF